MPIRRFATTVLAALLMMGCEESTPTPAFERDAFYAELQTEAEAFAFSDGQWLEDYGDAAFYGLAYYAWAGTQSGDASYLQRAEQAAARATQVVANADLLAGDVNEIAMSALGLIEYIAATGDRAGLAHLRALIVEINSVVELVGWYLDSGIVSGYAVDTYGPTSVSGLVALINAQYAYVLGGDDRAAFTSWSEQMATKIAERAWDGTAYRFSDARAGLFLYPNVTMLLLHARLYQLTGDAAHHSRVLAIYRAIQPLRVEAPLVGPGRYRSPYSAEHMGATTDDYTTLSSQNYVLLALIALSEITGEARYLEEFNHIVDFLADHLHGQWCRSHIKLGTCTPTCATDQACVDGACWSNTCQAGVLHHWMDGKIAQSEHPEVFCSGCNLQLLYIMWYRQFRLPDPR